jgi:tRNA modification GTPase
MVESRFRPARGRPWSSLPPGRLAFGHFDLRTPHAPREGVRHAERDEHDLCDASLLGEEVVVRRRSDCSVELHCHGGMAAVAAIGQALAQRGCQAVSWQQWVGGQQSDAIASAARLALAQARTERTALILLDQYHGALRAAVEAVRQSLAGGDLPSARQQLAALLARADLGCHLTNPWRVVLAGLPNVGKSSLINALVGYQRAIVHPAPGTTRDVVAATTALEGWPVELRDTAGLRTGGHPVEQAGVARARDELRSGDLVLLIFDAGQPWSSAAEALRRSRPDALVVHNKCDLPAAPGVAAGANPQRPPGVSTSALTGEGLDRLIRVLVARLVPHPPLPGDPVPFTAEQCQRLRFALAALERNDRTSAEEALEMMLAGI